LEQHRNPKGPLEREFENGQIIQLHEHKIRDGYTVIIRTDVTAERMTQDMAATALERSDGRFRALNDNAGHGILVHRDRQPLYANKVLAEMYGYQTPEELLALESTAVLTHPDFRGSGHEDRLAGLSVLEDKETMGVRKNGDGFWEDRRSFVIDWEGGPAVCSMRYEITDRIQAEAALRKAHDELEEKVAERTKELSDSEANFRGAIASLQEGFALFDTDDRFVLANDEYRRMHHAIADILKPGLRFEDLLRENLIRGNIPEALGREEEFIRDRMAHHRNPKGAIIRELSDGICFIVKESKTPNGGTVITQSDIGERLRTERILNAAIESIPGGFVLWDPDDRLALYNENYIKDRPKVAELLQIGVTFEEYTVAREKKKLRGSLVGGNEKQSLEDQLENHRNPTRTFLSPQPGGRIMQIKEAKTSDGFTVCIRTDITDLLKAEETICQSRDRFNAFIEHCPASISLKSREGQYIFANKMWHEWHSNIAEKAVGNFTQNVLRPGEVEDALALDEEVVETGQVVERERMLPGAEFLTLVQKFPVFDGDGNVESIGTLRTDITARQKAEERLTMALIEARRANEVKSTFMANMSHELWTPLNAVLGFSEIMHRERFGALGSQRYVDYAGDIHSSSQHLLNLINDILDLAAIEADQKTLNKEQFAFLEVVADCSSIVVQGAEKKSISYKIDVPNDLPSIVADRRALKQIMLNILANAVNFTPAGGSIRLKARALESQHSIAVHNTGPAIPPEKMALVIQPFMRAESDPYRAEEGSGLGLAIVKSLLDGHGGTLDIQSDVDLGTTVTIGIPRA
jgi:PAS domain S-box-containing protein